MTPVNDFNDDLVIDEDYDDDEEETDDDISDDLDIDDDPEPSLTYKIDFDTGRVIGKCDGEEALVQSIKMALATPKSKYVIFSLDYGSELPDLIGSDPRYALSIIEHMIEECLDDDRIESLSDFDAEIGDDNDLIVGFTVHSTVGDFDMESVVSI